ncbi:pleckstriny domain-containing family G member 5-like protein, partial [Leptotrombidium deliense]
HKPSIASLNYNSIVFEFHSFAFREKSSKPKILYRSQSQRSRRGALMVSEEDGVDENPLHSQDYVIRSLKLRSTHRKSGSIFSNPFKSDREKMEQLTELLNYYSANGIPDATGVHVLRRNRTLDDIYDLEDHWQCFVDVSDEHTKRLQNQQDAIWELLQTEVSYIKMLKVISELFVSCLCALQSECLLNDVDNEKMFSNITEVFTANHQLWIDYLLPMLNESRNTHQPLNPLLMTDAFLNVSQVICFLCVFYSRVHNKSCHFMFHREKTTLNSHLRLLRNAYIAACFHYLIHSLLSFEQIFQPYIKYCLEHSSCLHFVKKKHKESELFKAYVVWCETRKDCDRLRLMDILVKPMQRLTKYSLLLKAILKKTDDEQQKDALKQMVFDATLRRRNDAERLASVANRIESYDVFDTNNDEVEKVLREYSNFDLNCPMLVSQSRQIRQLLLEGSNLKLRDSNTSGKVDVHCFLFTDILLVCKSVGKKSGDKVRVIRQPYLIDRLVIHELKDNTGFIVIYLNEFNVATAVFTLHSVDSKTWIDFIRKAQKKYKECKQNSLLSAQQSSSIWTFEVDEEFELPSTSLLRMVPSSLRSSRSSLVQSHSGSVEMSDTSAQGSMIVAPMPTPTFLSQIDVNEQHPSRAVSFELGELRNPSMTVDDLDAFGRSKSVETRTPVSVTVTSPRPERRAFLLRGAGGAIPTNSTNTNTLSVNVPFHISKVSPQLLEPTSIQVPVPHSSGKLFQRSVQTTSKPPLVKTKNVPTPSLTVHSAPASTGASPVYSLESEGGSESGGSDEQESLKSRLNQKRVNRGERRYHTADSIDNIKKDKDSSIHKRLSWNLGANQGNNRLLCNKHLIKCLSSDSVYTSSGFSSTESVTLSVGSEQCTTDAMSRIQEIDRIKDEPQKASDIKIDVSEVKDGISSVQITVNGNCGGKPSKTELQKMKEMLLTSMDAS